VPGKIDPRIDDIHDVMADWAEKDPFREASLWEGAIAQLKLDIQSRRAEVVEQATRCEPPGE
jgi:hypothetical protein